MVRLPDDAGVQPVDAGDARYDPDRDPDAFEHWALLDVQLEVAVQVVRPPGLEKRLGPPARLRQRLAQAATGRVQEAKVSLLEGSGDRSTADAAQAEVVRLFPEKVNYNQVVVQLDTRLAQTANRLDGTENADDAVVAATALHGVGV